MSKSKEPEPQPEPEPPEDTTEADQAAELARQAEVERAVHNLVYFGDGTPRPLP